MDDYCDRCVAVAKTRVVLLTGELFFCGHHTNEYRHQLEDVAIEIELSEELTPA